MQTNCPSERCASTMKRTAAILRKLGITIPKEAHILDFGCGAGRTVYSLLDQGYINIPISIRIPKSHLISNYRDL